MSVLLQLQETADWYITALHQGDTQTLDRLFADSARLYSGREKGLVEMSKREYIDMVAAREASTKSGFVKSGGVVGAGTISDDKAVVKVDVALGPKSFTDFLVMVKIDGRWVIVSKVFHAHG